MKTGGNKDFYIGIRLGLTDAPQQDGSDDLRGHWTTVVRADDNDVLLSLCQLLECWGSDGLI
jgi:hypothetical protein